MTAMSSHFVIEPRSGEVIPSFFRRLQVRAPQPLARGGVHAELPGQVGVQAAELLVHRLQRGVQKRACTRHSTSRTSGPMRGSLAAGMR
jgi:hypothetical protein